MSMNDAFWSLRTLGRTYSLSEDLRDLFALTIRNAMSAGQTVSSIARDANVTRATVRKYAGRVTR